MKFMDYLNAAYSWFQEKLQAAKSWLKEQGRQTREQAVVQAREFLSAPLSEAEYALLKRVSGIVGTAVAVYITLMAGFETAVMVFGLCVILSYALHRVARQREQAPVE